MKVVPEKNAVRILWGRERGTQALGAQRLLQELVEDKTRWMKWEGKVRLWIGVGEGRQGYERKCFMTVHLCYALYALWFCSLPAVL